MRPNWQVFLLCLWAGCASAFGILKWLELERSNKLQAFALKEMQAAERALRVCEEAR